MAPPPPAGPASEPPDAVPSLWRELADGSAGPVVKVFVSIALAPLLGGAALFGSLVLASLVPSFNYGRAGRGYLNPDDYVIGWMLLAGGLLWVAGVTWVATRGRRRAHRAIWGAVLLTISVVAATVVGGVMLDAALVGPAEEIGMIGAICVAASLLVLIWVQAARRQARAIPAHNAADGALDVRCPACGYRMVGLHESRCPECGTGYTLDELLGRQAFITRAHRQHVGPAPSSTGNGAPTSG